MTLPAHAFGVTIVILAAGRGTRFDPTGATLKLLARLPHGRSVIRAAAEACTQAHAQTVVVCNPAHQARIGDALCDLDVQLLACPDADAGIGASLKAGLACTRPSIGWLVMLGDMPYVQASTVRAVADALRGGALLVRPYWNGQPGHPVGFSREMEAEFMNLSDEEGGARLFREHADRVLRIPSCDRGCVLDIDHPEDLDTAG
ncbi:nucleotidyltransferase family protein [Parapusillimonas sp. SGNA-6]|nr:nucleotidyltransferase family protein [Parapusillimonas sp. SGNA-6]